MFVFHGGGVRREIMVIIRRSGTASFPHSGYLSRHPFFSRISSTTIFIFLFPFPL